MVEQQQTKDTFSAVVRAEAAAVAGNAEAGLAGRPAVKGITIDGLKTREVDDAFWVERVPGGGYQLQVSIADVGSWITPNLTPALNRQAYRKAFTRYAAGYTRPMLPRQLSEDRLSLLEGQLRPTITITIPLDAQLAAGEPQIAQTVLCSSWQLDYAAAERAMDQPDTELGAMLLDGWEIAQRLLLARRLQGALAVYDLPSGWMSTEEGFLRRLGAEECYKAQVITAECMILSNLAFAHLLAKQGVLALYRNQKASAIAPERSTLLQMLDTALGHSTRAFPERISATFELALERASYAPTLEGHFGLNVPAYIHLTSPLRRYSDLVNQQILLAALRGERPPYTKAALEEIAAWINRREQEAKEARRAHFLSVYDQQIGMLVAEAASDPAAEALPLAHLDARQFHSVLRIAAEGQTLFPAVEQEILRRLESRQMYVHDLFTLVFRFTTSGAAWERVKVAALRYLWQTPEYASSLLLMGAQMLSWSAPAYEIIPDDGQHAPLFQARVSITRAGRSYASAWHSAPQKRGARHLAAAELALHLAGVSQEAQEAIAGEAEDENAISLAGDAARRPASVPALPQPDLAGQAEQPNYKGQLQEQLQARRWARPVYVARGQSGPPHAPLFVVEAQVSLPGGDYAAQGEGRTRIEAEQHAAEQLLDLLAQTLAQEMPPAAPADTQNAVSALHELQQHAAIRAVTYSYEQQGEPHDAHFLCTCRVTAADEEVVEGTGMGKTKKQAAQEAALQALEACYEL